MVRKALCLVVLVLVVRPVVVLAAGIGEPISDLRLGLSSWTGSARRSAAFNGDRFLIAFTSALRGGQALMLDSAGRRMSDTAFHLPLQPRFVFWNGREFVVIGERSDYVRVSAEGILLDASARAFEIPPLGGQLTERMVWSGSSLFILLRSWVPGPPSDNLVLCVLDADLQLRWMYAYQTSGPGHTATHLVSDGESVLLLYREGPAVGLVFSPDGGFLRKREVVTDPTILIRAVGSPGDGSGYLGLAGGYGRVRAFSIDSALGLRDFGERDGEAMVDLSWDGSVYTALYQASNRKIHASRLSRQGLLLDDQMALDIVSVNDVSGVGGRGTTLMLYSRCSGQCSPNERVLHARVGHDAAGLLVAEDHALEQSVFVQETPASATMAMQSLVTWRERIDPFAPPVLFATRISADGAVLDPGSLLVARHGTCDQSRPAVATNGTDYLVAWFDVYGVAAARVGADGSVTRPTLVHNSRIPCRTGSPLIVWNGTHYLVIWSTTVQVPLGPGATVSQVTTHAARLNADGSLVDSEPLEIGRTTGNVVAASDGRDFILVWNDRFLRLSGGGKKIDSSGGRLFPGVTASAIWWNGSSYTVKHALSSREFLTRISREGVVTEKVASRDVIPWRSEDVWLNSSAAACDGDGCSTIQGRTVDGRVLLFEDRVDDDGETASFAFRRGSEIAPIVPTSVSASYNFNLPLPGAAVRLANGSLFAAYARRRPEPPYAGAPRIFLHRTEAPRKARGVRH